MSFLIEENKTKLNFVNYIRILVATTKWEKTGRVGKQAGGEVEGIGEVGEVGREANLPHYANNDFLTK